MPSDYLDFLEEIKADYITVGDAGVFYICNRDKRPFKMIYDASTMVTSAVRLISGANKLEALKLFWLVKFHLRTLHHG